MIPKIIISDNLNQIENYIKDFSIKNNSDFNQISIGLNLNSIKIEEIRGLKQQIYFSTNNNKLKTIIIYNSHNLTKEAQNSLLKILEEPPKNVAIFLITTNENLLLPTIISRCEILRFKLKNNYQTDNDKKNQNFRKQKNNQQNKSILQQILKLDIGEKFKLAEELSAKENKEDSLENIRAKTEKWLDQAINELQTNIKFDPNTTVEYFNILKSLFLAKRQINQNLNIRLVLENLFLNF